MADLCPAVENIQNKPVDGPRAHEGQDCKSLSPGL